MKCVAIKGPRKLVVENREALVGKKGYILIDVINKFKYVLILGKME